MHGCHFKRDLKLFEKVRQASCVISFAALAPLSCSQDTNHRVPCSALHHSDTSMSALPCWSTCARQASHAPPRLNVFRLDAPLWLNVFHLHAPPGSVFHNYANHPGSVFIAITHNTPMALYAPPLPHAPPRTARSVPTHTQAAQRAAATAFSKR